MPALNSYAIEFAKRAERISELASRESVGRNELMNQLITIGGDDHGAYAKCVRYVLSIEKDGRAFYLFLGYNPV